MDPGSVHRRQRLLQVAHGRLLGVATHRRVMFRWLRRDNDSAILPPQDSSRDLGSTLLAGTSGSSGVQSGRELEDGLVDEEDGHVWQNVAMHASAAFQDSVQSSEFGFEVALIMLFAVWWSSFILTSGHGHANRGFGPEAHKNKYAFCTQIPSWITQISTIRVPANLNCIGQCASFLRSTAAFAAAAASCQGKRTQHLWGRCSRISCKTIVRIAAHLKHPG